jgi:aminocarboxymuconate-semialdehyde decarboxylase
MPAVDCHFHWYPRSLFEDLGRRSDPPRAEPCTHSYSYWYKDGRKSTLRLDWNFHDLEQGLDVAEDAAGSGTSVVCTAGILAGLLDQLPTGEAAKIASAYNEAMAEAQRGHAGRLYGTALIPLRDTDEAIRLTDQAINEFGLVGVNLPAVTDGELIDVTRLEAFYAYVAETGKPLIVHPTDILYQEFFSEYDGAMHLTMGRVLDSSLSILRLIFSGILERHSTLKVLHTNAGGLLPYQAGRIDKNVGSNKQISALPHKPSEYLRRIFVDTVAPEPLTLTTAIQFYGLDHVLYGTDYPCWAPRAAVSVLEGAGLTGEERARVLSGNATALFGLPPAG